MTRSTTAAGARIALEPPEQSAGGDGAAIRQLWWSTYMRDRSALATFQPRHSIRSHPITTHAAHALESLRDPRTANVKRMLEDFLDAIAHEDTTDAPELRFALPDDGSILLEWTFKDRRFGMSFEENEGESGWYFVFSREPSSRCEAGTMDQLDMKRMAKLSLNP